MVTVVDDKEIPEVNEMRNLYSEIYAACNTINGTLKKFEIIPPNGNKGISILDVKTDTMLSYLINLTYLILKKICGQSIDDNETRERLVNARIILEKIKPLEDKLKYQIQKVMRSTSDVDDATDKNNFRANVSDLDESEISENEEDKNLDIIDNDEVKEEKKVQIYKPPKLAAVPYVDVSKEEKQRKLLENAKKRALHSSVMQELKEEYLDTPLEISTAATTLRNTHSKYKKEKEKYEETYFTRLPVTKKEKHRDKLMNSITVGTLGNEITRFEDISALEGRLPKITKKRKKSVNLKKKKKSFKKKRFM